MTNKQELPVIGKRYKRMITDEEVEVLSSLVTVKSHNRHKTDALYIAEYGIETFYDMFKELPDQEPTIPLDGSIFQSTGEQQTTYECSCGNKIVLEYQEPTKEPVVKKSFTTDKVQEALKELKKDLADFGEGLLDDDVDGEGFDIYSSAMELVNALEEQKEEMMERIAKLEGK